MLFRSDEGVGAAAASEIARGMLNSFTSSTPKVPSSSVKSTLNDDLILMHSVIIDGITTIAPAAASTSEITEPSPLSSSSTEAPLPPSSADYANPFHYEPAPVQNLNTKVEHSNDVPVVAKLQTDLFDDEDEDYENGNEVNRGNEQEQDDNTWSQRYPQRQQYEHGHRHDPGYEASVTVRGNVYVHDPRQGGSSNASGHTRKIVNDDSSYVYGRKMNMNNNAHQHQQPPRIRIHDRMYTPKPGSVVIIEPVEIGRAHV